MDASSSHEGYSFPTEGDICTIHFNTLPPKEGFILLKSNKHNDDEGWLFGDTEGHKVLVRSYAYMVPTHSPVRNIYTEKKEITDGGKV